MLILVLHRE